MTHAHSSSGPAIVAGFLRALRPALEPGADAEMRQAARDVAQVLHLPGLDAALAEGLRHHGTAPREAAHVISRIVRLAETAEREGSLVPFTDADGQLGALAETLAGLDWTTPSATSPTAAALSAADVLADVVPDSLRALERLRFAPVAAGAMRAALDWLLEPDARPELHIHDTSIALVLPEARPERLALAGATLSAADGALLQGEDGRWQMRVPLLVERPSFLLVRQGHLALALPWSAVARLRMFSVEARAALREPVLAPLAPAAELHGERPCALIVHGLRRAWCVVERIVWRIVAEPSEPDRASPMPGLERSIDVEEGDRYWVAEPAWLLRRVAAAETPESSWRPKGHSLPELSADAPLPEPAAFEPLAPESIAAPVLASPMQPTLLTSAHATPLSSPRRPSRDDVQPHEPPPLERRVRVRAADESAPLAASDATTAPSTPSPAPPRSVQAITTVLGAASEAPEQPLELSSEVENAEYRPTWHEAPRALVIDDSLVARLFLGRLLERRGFQVESAADSVDGLQMLALGPWSVVFADLALPGIAPEMWLRQVVQLQQSSPLPFSVVVLTRDRDDERAAGDAAMPYVLRKPFESESLDDLLSRLPRDEES